MMNTSAIQEHMKVIGSDGQHVGVVDAVEGDRIKLTRNDPAAGGEHHFIPMQMVNDIDDAVRLAIPGDEAKRVWQTQ